MNQEKREQIVAFTEELSGLRNKNAFTLIKKKLTFYLTNYDCKSTSDIYICIMVIMEYQKLFPKNNNHKEIINTWYSDKESKITRINTFELSVIFQEEELADDAFEILFRKFFNNGYLGVDLYKHFYDHEDFYRELWKIDFDIFFITKRVLLKMFQEKNIKKFEKYLIQYMEDKENFELLILIRDGKKAENLLCLI